MTTTKTLVKAQMRQRCTKGLLRKSRVAGNIPATIYSKGKSLTISVEEKTLPKGHSYSTVIDLELEGVARKCLLREVQVDTLTSALVHMDFQEVSPTDVVRCNVPIEFVGMTKEQEKEGFLKPLVRVLEVKGQVATLPKTIVVNVSTLTPDQVALLKDVQIPEGITVPGSMNVALATIIRK